MKKLLFGVCIGIGLGIAPAYAQETENNGYNPNSVHPIHEDDIMFKKKLWRRMDLEEKQNRPFFAFNNQITKHIIEAAEAGILPIYKNDSLKSRMTKEEFLENLENPALKGMNQQDDAWGNAGGGGADDGWGDSGGGSDDGWGSDDSWGDSGGGDSGSADAGSGTTASQTIDTKFSPRDVSVLEIVEDMIFDRKRSTMYWDIQAITLIIPAKNFTSGIYRPVGTFRYKDLVKLFRSMPEEAIWFNPQNSAEHKNLADAFQLRLFKAHITKVANPQDNAIVDIYDESPKQGIMASQWMEYQLMEKEHELWSF